ncbi:hypothetical protein ECEC1735_2903 [Escherichia coli EC1735]|nr:hypothetical protein ECEC1735_2903 [Escherichia coli EC1735]
MALIWLAGYPAGVSLFRYSDTFFTGRHSPEIFCSSLAWRQDSLLA